MAISLDLETNGLIGDQKPPEEPPTQITCIGLGSDSGVQQFTSPWSTWNTDPESAERNLLTRFSQSRLLNLGQDTITYNGNSFDFPLLKERLQHFNLPAIPDDFVHIDQMEFTLLVQKYRCTKEEAAARYADLYVPKTTRAVYCARAYLYKKVTHKIHMSMLAHNCMDVCTTLTYHNEMTGYPDYDEFVAKIRAAHPSAQVQAKKADAVEAFL